jgi:hypothetical protein
VIKIGFSVLILIFIAIIDTAYTTVKIGMRYLCLIKSESSVSRLFNAINTCPYEKNKIIIRVRYKEIFLLLLENFRDIIIIIPENDIHNSNGMKRSLGINSSILYEYKNKIKNIEKSTGCIIGEFDIFIIYNKKLDK